MWNSWKDSLKGCKSSFWNCFRWFRALCEYEPRLAAIAKKIDLGSASGIASDSSSNTSSSSDSEACITSSFEVSGNDDSGQESIPPPTRKRKQKRIAGRLPVAAVAPPQEMNISEGAVNQQWLKTTNNSFIFII